MATVRIVSLNTWTSGKQPNAPRIIKSSRQLPISPRGDKHDPKHPVYFFGSLKDCTNQYIPLAVNNPPYKSALKFDLLTAWNPLRTL